MGEDKNYNRHYDERELRAILSEQVREIGDSESEQDNYQQDTRRSAKQETAATKTKKKKHTGIKVFACITLLFAIAIVFLVGTKPGRKAIYAVAGNYIFEEVVRDEDATTFMNEHNEKEPVGKKEEGVKNYLLFGLEEIKGGSRSDTMMIASVNMNTGTIKLISLMRDSYVDVPGWKSTKLNAAYGHGGVKLLIDTIEANYKLHIDGYASVNFESFEKIVDSIGGVTIELGAKEAKYLNRTNYISNPEYRNVVEGVNVLNGNQLLGYCRVRKVATLGGANNDYGRTVRHRRAMSAIFEKFKSLNIFTMFSTANDCMGYVTTSLTSQQIREIIEVVVENKITSVEEFRLPVDGMFNDPKSYNGTSYPLVYDWDKNIAELYKFIYEDGNSLE